MAKVKKITFIFTGAIVVLILLSLYFLTWSIPLHNQQLLKFQEKFRLALNSVHPKQSALLAEVTEVGNWGNSNHCDFLVGQFRSSSLTRGVIENTYATSSAFVVFPGSDSSSIPNVYYVNDEIFKHDPWSEWSKKYLAGRNTEFNDETFFVWVSSDDHSPEGDIRCH